MKLLHIFLVALVLWFANQLVESKITCSKNQYTVVENGTESCLACNPCPDGRGLFPPCGSKVDHPPPIDCVPCVPGKTYSDEYGPSSCKNCHLCSAKEIVTRNCTTTENTICSNTCEEGFYYENSTHDCQPCSECCNKGNDIVIKECKSMPPNKQCSALSAKKCKPKPTNVIVTAYSRTTKSTSSMSVPKKPSTGKITYSVAGAVGGVILIIVLIVFYKRKKKKKRRDIDCNSRREGMMEDGTGDHDQLLVNVEPDHCDLNHMPLKVTNNSPDQLSEGQRISLLLNCDNQNGDIKENNRKCNFGFEWKKDGDSMPKNINHKCSKNLIIDDVEVADSGHYYCEIHCYEHPNHKRKSSVVEIHVEPGEGTELKLFTDLDWNIQMKIANSLKPKTVGIGNWMDLGIKFEIEEDALKALDKDKAPSEVLENIKCDHPGLTVLEFCEIMKSMKQNKIVIFLKDQLTNKPKEPTRSGINASNRPDSGYIAEELDSDGPLRVDLPPDKAPVSSKLSQPMIQALVNLGHVDSSREASRESSVEDLPSTLLNNVQNSKPMEDKVSKKLKSRLLRRKKSGDFQNVSDENNDFKDEDQDEKSDMGKKSRYGRQTSKDSQKNDGINASNRPDGGYIAEKLDSDGTLRVDLPPDKSPVSSKPSQLTIPAQVNLGHVDSSREASREGSVEDLRSALLNNVQNSKPMEDKVSKKLKSRLLRRKKSGDFQNVSDGNNDFKDEDQDEKSDMGKKSRYGRQTSKDSQKSDDIEDFGTRERKRSRSSSITSIIKEKLQKTPSVEYSALDHHHEESDEGALS